MKVAIILEEFDKAINYVTDYMDHPNILFELRLDKDRSLLRLFNQFPRLYKKAIITLRSKSEGGEYDGKNRKEILVESSKYSPKYLDLELHRDMSILPQLNQKFTIPVVSSHNFQKPMTKAANEYLESICEITSSVVFKFVGLPTDPLDLLESIDLLRSNVDWYIVLGMNTAGMISRTLSRDFSQKFVFGSTRRSIIPEFAELLALNRTDSLLIGLIGKSLDHSLSPKLHTFFMKEKNLSGYYHLFEFNNNDRVKNFIDKMKASSLRGMNITFPYKKTAVDIADYRTKEVEISGVCNTIKYEDNQVHAYNTDILGFQKFATEDLNPRNETFLIFGAGGAGIAVGLALLELGKQITYVNRSKKRLDNLPRELQKKADTFLLENFNALQHYDVYINATSIGYGHQTPTEILPIPDGVKEVVDLNYGESNTGLVNEVISQGMNAFDGKKMLFHQAVEAFEIWSGTRIDRKSFYSKFIEVIK